MNLLNEAACFAEGAVSLLQNVYFRDDVKVAESMFGLAVAYWCADRNQEAIELQTKVYSPQLAAETS